MAAAVVGVRVVVAVAVGLVVLLLQILVPLAAYLDLLRFDALIDILL